MELKLSEFIIRQFINNGYEFFTGRQLAEEGKVAGVRLVSSERLNFAGKVKDGEKEYLAEAEFNIKGQPSDCSCTCRNTGRCRHAAALLFRLMNDRGERTWDLSTNYVASKNLLNMFERHRLNRLKKLTAAASGGLRLEPVFYFERDRIEMELYISRAAGQKKPVEDIFAFASEIDRNTGKNFREYKYNISSFDSTGRQILGLMYNRAEIKAGFIALERLNEDKSRFILEGPVLDDFFDCFLKKRLPVCADGEIVYVDLEVGEPPAGVAFSVSEGRAALKKQFSSERIYTSASYGYILIGRKLFRTSAEYALVMKDIEAAFEINNNADIVFETSDLGKLVDYGIPVLKEMSILENSGAVYEKLNRIPFGAQIFIETRGKSICGRVRFVYGDTVIDYNDKRAFREFRDDRAETVFRLVLEEMGFFDSGSEGFILSGDEQIYGFLRYGLNALGKNAEVFLSDSMKELKKSAEKVINIGIRYEGRLLDIDFDVDTIDIGEMESVLEAYEERKRYFRFSDGRYLSLEGNTAFLKLVNYFDPSKKALKEGRMTADPSRLMVIDSFFDENDKRLINMDKKARRLSLGMKEIRNSDYALPKVYEPILRDYQKKGFRWLKAIGECGLGGILADDMGLGKTVQLISFLYDRYKTNTCETRPSLVICPTSVIFNWEVELESFGCGLEFEIVYGSREKRQRLLKKHTNVFVTSYEALRRDAEIYENMEFFAVIADEAQNIKNHSTKVFSAVTSIDGEVRLALTGTPFENNLGELWSIFRFVLPGYLGSSRRFSAVFEKPVMKKRDMDKIRELKKLISPFILRREKGDVLKDLPEKTENYRYMFMTEEQGRLYRAELLKARGIIKADFGSDKTNRIKILSEITKLRQICCHPSLFLEGYKGRSGKLEYLMENIDGLIKKEHKILLFSQFTSMLSIIKERLSLKGYDFYYIDGATPADKRLEYVNSFNTGDKIKIFLISLKAGGTGVNLTGADVVIHFDQWWNPAVMAQASDRAHRFGQIRRVQVYNLITKDSIEEKILKLQNKKKQLFKDVLDMEGGFLDNMSREEILELFS